MLDWTRDDNINEHKVLLSTEFQTFQRVFLQFVINLQEQEFGWRIFGGTVIGFFVAALGSVWW